MEIDLGSRMIVEFMNKDRMNCRFVGMAIDEFLLIRVPLTPGIRDRMAEGVTLQFRYLKTGKIISFRADVLRHQAFPVSLAFITYPTKTVEHNLRKEGRIECNFPTEIVIGGENGVGRIDDINHSGCKFIFASSSDLPAKVGASVGGSFVTMEGEKRYGFKGEIMALHNMGAEIALGLRFEGKVELPEKLQELLEQCCALTDDTPAGSHKD